MSYLFVIIIGAIVGFVAGQYIKGSEQGVGLDLLAGGLGGCLAVVLSRFVGPAASAGMLMSAIVTILGSVLSLYLVRQFMKPKPVPAPRSSRRF
jgi:uncharacterized membrane protein YeaQ/YmgE (transglycosylase-associated protein family)